MHTFMGKIAWADYGKDIRNAQVEGKLKLDVYVIEYIAGFKKFVSDYVRVC